MINQPPPFKGLNIRMPTIFPIKRRGVYLQGVYIATSYAVGMLTNSSSGLYDNENYKPFKTGEENPKPASCMGLFRNPRIAKQILSSVPNQCCPLRSLKTLSPKTSNLDPNLRPKWMRAVRS